MGTLEFMNQDGEWEKFPSDDEIAIMQEMIAGVTPVNPPVYPEVMTICHLCNEPFPMEQIQVTGGNPVAGYTWSCPKCHAVTSTGKA